MRKLLYFILLILLIISTSCGGEGEKIEEPEEPIQEVPKDDETEEPEDEEEQEIDPREEALKVIEDLQDKGYIQSNLNGSYIDEDSFNLRPVTVMYDNHPYARWQAGIVKADIVYECEVEFPFTRYLAVFQDKKPEHIGPVRSARPYYLRYALEYDSIYVHVGGSNEAKVKIQDYYMANVDGLYSGNFWRYNDTGKYIPNNMYTDMENIREAQKSSGYRVDGDFEGYKFNDIAKPINDNLSLENCNEINIIFNSHYEVKFSYDEYEEIYNRYVNDEKQIDEYYEEDIEASNIILIKTSKQVLDDVGRLSINTVGEGEGAYITKGELADITYKKESYNSKTHFYYENGEELVLNPGQTWIEVVTQDTSINYKEE
ncbi:MAG: DUF3048 domain-containing protein [Eubacteriales bacterium]